ncbi:MAG: hypothetical protein ABIB71_04255 [Candidatus Woesearchaeota archaeon]
MSGIKGKKGISQIIAFVLLLSFAVGLGTVVIMWYTSTTETQTETLITPAEGRIECDEVMINLKLNYNHCNITVYNFGVTTIYGLMFTPPIQEWDKDQDGKKELVPIADIIIKPRESRNVTVNAQITGTEIEINPAIKVGDKITTCTNSRKFSLEQNFPLYCLDLEI